MISIELERPETVWWYTRPGLTLNRTELDRRAAMQSTQTPTCTYCGGDFAPHQARGGYRFCSKSCAQRARNPEFRGIACTAPGCERTPRGKYCEMHKARLRHHGTLDIDPRYEMTEEARFWSKVDLSGECWVWTNRLNNHGYGVFNTYLGDKTFKHLAHRYALRVLGLLDESLVVLHSCDNPRCVNPEHLSQGTQSDNMRDAARKGRIRNQFGEQQNRDGLTNAERAAGQSARQLQRLRLAAGR